MSIADVDTKHDALSLRYWDHTAPPSEPFETVTVKTYSTPARRGMPKQVAHVRRGSGGNAQTLVAQVEVALRSPRDIAHLHTVRMLSRMQRTTTRRG